MCTASTRQIAELKRSCAALTEQLTVTRDSSRADFEAKLSAEVTRLRETTARDAAAARCEGREAFERENRTLRETRAEAVAALEVARTELRELAREHEVLVLSHGAAAAAAAEAAADARGALRLKAFELSQLGAAHEARSGALRQAELRCELLSSQVEAHREQFAALEAASAAEARQLQAALTAEQDKAAAYEALELDLDSAVVRAAAAEEEAASGSSAAGTSGTMIAAGSSGSSSSAAAELAVGAVPTAPRRRVRQAVQLARRLLCAEGELQQCRRELAASEQRAAAAASAAAAAESLLQDAQQPTRYMVDAVRDREAEAAEWRTRAAQAEQRVAELQVCA
jgi:trimeric autotransporter adhesin